MVSRAIRENVMRVAILTFLLSFWISGIASPSADQEAFCEGVLPVAQIAQMANMEAIQLTTQVDGKELKCFYAAEVTPVLTASISKDDFPEQTDMRYKMMIVHKYAYQRDSQILKDVGDEALLTKNQISGSTLAAARKGTVMIVLESFPIQRRMPAFLSEDQLLVLLRQTVERIK